MLILALALSGAGLLCGLIFDLLGRRESRVPSSSAEPEVRPSRDAMSGEQWESRRGTTVLLAEADSGVRRTLSEALQLAGHNVVTAETSDEARRLLAERHVDVLVLDMSTDGWSVLRHFGGSLPLTIVVTDEEFSPRDMREFFQIRPAAILHKPVPPPRLLNAIAEAIGTPSALHQSAESDGGDEDAAPEERDEHPEGR